MIRICFVCLGNICRSPMAEFMMRDIVGKMGLEKEYVIASRGTSYEEEGNDLYPPAKEKLVEEGIPFTRHFATRLEKEDYDQFDYFYCMDQNNIRGASRILGTNHKIYPLLDRDITDPWYSGDFTKTYLDLCEGIQRIIKKTSY